MKITHDAIEKHNSAKTIIDWDHWSKLSKWSIEEAAALSMGRDPYEVDLENIKNQRGISSLHQETFKRLEIFQRNLNPEKKPELQNYSPQRFLDLAKIKSFNFPIQLTTLINERVKNWNQNQSQDQMITKEQMDQNKLAYDDLKVKFEELTEKHKSLTTRNSALTTENKTKNKIILAMALKHYNFKPNKSHSSAAKQIASSTELYGISVHEDTVRKHLNEAEKQEMDKFKGKDD